jgi:hypothetical protein
MLPAIKEIKTKEWPLEDRLKEYCTYFEGSKKL